MYNTTIFLCLCGIPLLSNNFAINCKTVFADSSKLVIIYYYMIRQILYICIIHLIYCKKKLENLWCLTKT